MGQDQRDTSGDGSHWLDRERVLLYPCLVILALYAGLAGIRVVQSLPELIDTLGRPIGNDFIEFWSAARLAVEGRPEDAYDLAAIAAMHRVGIPGLKNVALPWHYPPNFLLILYPLGFLPYLPALGAYLVATVGLWAALVRRLYADPRAWVVAAAFPAGLYNFGSGQNGFLTAGLAGFALLLLDRRPVLSGVFIGLLSIKPHLAVLFPIALAAERRWQTFGAAAVTALAFTALSIIAFGRATIPALLQDLATVREIIDNPSRWSMVPTVYVFGLSLGMPSPAAMVLHGIVALGAAGCVWFVWRIAGAPREAKLATLAAASLLISPYIFVYDLTWTGLAIAWLAVLGMQTGFRAGERELLAAAWIGSALPRVFYDLTAVQFGWVLPFALMIAGTFRALRPKPACSHDPPTGTAAVRPAGSR